MSEPRNPDYHKYADDQVRTRELEDAIGRLRLALFVAALGPAILTLSWITTIGLAKPVRVAVLATAPIGLLLMIFRYVQVPPEHRTSRIPVTILVSTVAAAIGTFVLAKKFSMFP
jgi:hypothetical protein